MDTLDAHLRELVRNACREAVADALEDADLGDARESEPASWRSRVHRVHEDTRLGLDDVADALGVSTRSVRRYVAGDGDYPPLPHAKGPTGITVTADALRTWIEDVEGSNRFRVAAGGGR